jgi:hypothetical protein
VGNEKPGALTGPTPPPPPQTLGTALAHEAVSQAAAMVVQDGAAFLRQVSSVTAAGIAVCTAKMIATQSQSPWTDIITALNKSLATAADTFKTMGTDAANVLGQFPSGS